MTRYVFWPEKGRTIFRGAGSCPSIMVSDAPAVALLSDSELAAFVGRIAESKAGLHIPIGSSHWPAQIGYQELLAQAEAKGVPPPPRRKFYGAEVVDA
jgi:hypothetical protein